MERFEARLLEQLMRHSYMRSLSETNRKRAAHQVASAIFAAMGLEVMEMEGCRITFDREDPLCVTDAHTTRGVTFTCYRSGCDSDAGESEDDA
jgi:hypothetical protein